MRERVFAVLNITLIKRVHLLVGRVDALISDVEAAVGGDLIADDDLMHVALEVGEDIIGGNVVIGLARRVYSVAFDESVRRKVDLTVGESFGA